MARYTLDQLDARYTKAFETAKAKAEKAGEKWRKHDMIRVVLAAGASNAMALKVLGAVEKPVIRMADIRWHRNQWCKEDDTTAVDHDAADAKELKDAGVNLEPSTTKDPKPPKAAKDPKPPKPAKPAKQQKQSKPRDIDPADLEF